MLNPYLFINFPWFIGVSVHFLDVCKNGGSVTSQGNLCWCECPKGFRGFECELSKSIFFSTQRSKLRKPTGIPCRHTLNLGRLYFLHLNPVTAPANTKLSPPSLFPSPDLNCLLRSPDFTPNPGCTGRGSTSGWAGVDNQVIFFSSFSWVWCAWHLQLKGIGILFRVVSSHWLIPVVDGGRMCWSMGMFSADPSFSEYLSAASL